MDARVYFISIKVHWVVDITSNSGAEWLDTTMARGDPTVETFRARGMKRMHVMRSTIYLLMWSNVNKQTMYGICGIVFNAYPRQIFPAIAIEIILLNTIDLWIMGIKWGFYQRYINISIYTTIRYTINVSIFRMVFFIPFLYYLIILLKMKLIITYNNKNISVY